MGRGFGWLIPQNPNFGLESNLGDADLLECSLPKDKEANLDTISCESIKYTLLLGR